MIDQKLNLNINLSETRYSGVPDITNYKLVSQAEVQQRIP